MKRIVPVALLGSLGVACGGNVVESSGATGSGGGQSCSVSLGTLSGQVYRYALPGDPASSPAPAAIVYLQKTPNDTPLQAMADAAGAYTVEIEAGSWLVGGEQQNCSASTPIATTVTACATTTLDVVLDACTK